MEMYEEADMQIQSFALDNAEEDRVRPRPSSITGGSGEDIDGEL